MKILLIDEEAISTSFLVRQIRQNFKDIEIDIATSCEKGLFLVDHRDYSLIILDLMLPKGNLDFPYKKDLKYGIDLLKVMKHNKPHLKIVCFTVLNNPHVEKEVNDLDADYVCKLEVDRYEKLYSIIQNL